MPKNVLMFSASQRKNPIRRNDASSGILRSRHVLHQRQGMGMRLSEFILANREPILEEWETFARS